MTLTNEKMKEYQFLTDMYSDEYFPDFLVDKCKAVLVELCSQIEGKKPTTNAELLVLSHAATERINELEEEFEDNESELETGAREALGGDFDYIVKAYGYDIDVEDVIATREW